jgi:hypothetical protein
VRLARAFIKAWPWLNGGYEFAMLLYQFLYMVWNCPLPSLATRPL